MNYTSAARHYQQVNIQSSVADANPHRLIQMLFEGALQRIAEAKGAIQRNDIALRGEKISKAINIVQGLQGSLSDSEGGELTGNLDQLYDYIVRQLISANRHAQSEKLDECARLLAEIKTAWDGIAVSGAPA